MDLTYGAEYESFRQQVRTFVERAWLPHAKLVKAERKAAEATFRREAIEQGYLYRAIPRQYGGSEQAPDVMRGQIIREEFGRVRAPMEVPGVGVGMLVPTLLECGTQEQKERFIAKTLTGEYLWAQGYSEPNAGSDLASVRTKGVLQGDEWVINGQKVWSTFAQYARFMFAMVRTELNAAKHDGLSYILLDLKQPGVTIRPLKQVTGGEEFCEVFFDDAKAPANWIVGERGKGWQVSKTTLVHERNSFIGNASSSQALFDKLVDLARNTQLNGKPASEDPVIRERLLVLEGYVASHVYSSYRQFSMTAHGQSSGIVGSMNKLISTQIGHEVAKLARDLMGDNLLIAPPPEGTRGAGPEKWNNQFFGSLGIAIAGGASNIQRNIIAERGLGLPRDNGTEAGN
ncbi:acyl-CoA dehydrogenase family protein [Stutzerimonas stutzeri]|uniref:acyl-CoA dehydrogenase family protein n=1 Tax=Stutzerimonas stutzeri TaxID=316 RepID=UPI0024489BDE|nr:acyl-CoA dehydrogenase family protein [Stutzerimonas stutzeri]MDH0426654.1 acyl-CoA dehydrogenase family protein [Stutzerimonas stutzeri]